MRAVRHFAVILLLLLSCVAPVMACLTPDAQMTAAERACCLTMRNQCAQMEMPVSQDCCAIALPSLFEHALKSSSVRFQPVVAMVLWVASFDVLTPESVSQAWIHNPEYWPPKSPPAAIAVLRI
jgi:hypothetical protein